MQKDGPGLITPAWVQLRTVFSEQVSALSTGCVLGPFSLGLRRSRVLPGPALTAAGRPRGPIDHAEYKFGSTQAFGKKRSWLSRPSGSGPPADHRDKPVVPLNLFGGLASFRMKVGATTSALLLEGGGVF